MTKICDFSVFLFCNQMVTKCRQHSSKIDAANRLRPLLLYFKKSPQSFCENFPKNEDSVEKNFRKKFEFEKNFRKKRYKKATLKIQKVILYR